MLGRVGGTAVGVALVLALAVPAAAQQWPAYGEYGYGSGFDYSRNAYSYPRPVTSESASMPEDTQSLYGGYMPTAYYSGAAYALDRASLFPSGQAFCQTAGSYLYCADLENAGVSLLAVGASSGDRTALVTLVDRGGDSGAYTGVLSTRTVGNTSSLVGTLRSTAGDEITVTCNGAPAVDHTSLTCH